MKKITIYTDGGCKPNPGPGGWAAILIYGTRERVLSGGDPDTTNNKMELTAALEGLRALKEPCAVRLHTDSAYLHQAFTQGWLKKMAEKRMGHLHKNTRQKQRALDWAFGGSPPPQGHLDQGSGTCHKRTQQPGGSLGYPGKTRAGESILTPAAANTNPVPQ